MNVRKGTAGLLLTALALTPGFLSAGPAAAQDQTKEKHGNRKGQTMTEYALILAAIAVVVYGTYRALGNNIGSLANGVDSTLTNA